MASLSVEEENYVRMSLLLTGISPRAARTFFDGEFAPACLGATIKKESNKLFDLKKNHRINQSQWNLLFPIFPDVPDSKTFDVTLMILLLRNLTPMDPPLCGFDSLPSMIEITHAADLARIKYYRNYLAHLDDGKLATGFFNTAWNDIACAIDRLGGQNLKHECDHLKTKPLDQNKQEIMMYIKHSNNEIRELKESFKSLKRSHTEMMKSHEVLQVDHRKVKKEIEIIKTSQMDSVPWNIRARINDTLQDWKDNDDSRFINTRAAQYVLKCIKENTCVTITASSGVGKTATLRHVALQMATEDYDVLMVTDPADILKFCNPKKKTLFVFDDLCGNFSLEKSDITSWEPIMKDIKTSLDKKQTKILAACRLQVYQDKKFNSLLVFKSCVCNMLSENICLSRTEKESIAKLYLNEKASEISEFSNLYDCFPLLCKLYHDNHELVITDFFQNPYSIYEAEIDTFLKKGHHAKYCALALCVIFDNQLEEDILTERVDEETSVIIENTCEACRLDRQTSRLVIQDELDSLKHTFITKEENVYKILHDKIFDFLVKIYGQQIVNCLIKNAVSGLIKERFVLEREDLMDQFIIVIPPAYHETYIKRIIDDWSNGNLQDVFSNINMKIIKFRQKLLCYLKTLDLSYQKKLANISAENEINNAIYGDYIGDDSDDDNCCRIYDTVLLNCCYIGDVSFVKWCCDHVVNVNRCTWDNQSPIMIACEHGHTEIFKMLVDKEADYNTCDYIEVSPVMKACEHGHTDIVKMLLDRGVDCNKCDWLKQSPVLLASANGHTEIVKILLDRGVDCNQWDDCGDSPLMKAGIYGDIEIVKTLLDRGNTCDNLIRSPVMQACKHGHTEIVKMLLDRGADCNACNPWGHSPLMIGCAQGHIEIVKMLLDRGADYNKCDLDGQAAVMKACENGHTETVKLLLERGVDYDKCDVYGQSPIRYACRHGHTEIVKMFLESGADYDKFNKDDQSPLVKVFEHCSTKYVKIMFDIGTDHNKCDKYSYSCSMKACEYGNKGNFKIMLLKEEVYVRCNKYQYSPVMKACEHGHTEIVKMLLDRGADYNKCQWYHDSPVMRACEHGHTDIVKMLLERGASCNEDGIFGQSPVMKSCENGHTELVKILLDKGADCNKCDMWGQSPVMLACEHGHTEIVKMFLVRGAYFNKCDEDDQSPLMKACEHGHKEIVQMLLDKGADYKKCDKYGYSPVMKACEHGQIEIVKMLLDIGADYKNVINMVIHL